MSVSLQYRRLASRFRAFLTRSEGLQYWWLAVALGVFVGDLTWWGDYPTLSTILPWETAKSFWPSLLFAWMGCPWARGVLTEAR